MIDLRTKILELFEYRRLPELITIGNGGKLDMQFYELLIDLQTKIYLLDHTLETTWQPDGKAIDRHWKLIHDCLRQLGVPSSDLDLYSRHIYKYQKHELELRQHRLPMRLSMEYFYFYKSCDVKLLRRLIYDRYPTLGRAHKLSGWRTFDLITEVNDDVEDVYEDLQTINGNRFLLTILMDGLEVGADTYTAFLGSLEDRLTGYGSFIDDMCLLAHRNTLELLDHRLATINKKDLQQAYILQYLDVRTSRANYSMHHR